MRGKGRLHLIRRKLFRITPAYAGKRIHKRRAFEVCWDHPRLCGEKVCLEIILRSIMGSPPPMRGKGKSASRNDFPNRITPAYAGKSQRRPPAECPDQDHPRLCGEKYRKRMEEKIDVRITPAYAGKSSSVFW